MLLASVDPVSIPGATYPMRPQLHLTLTYSAKFLYEEQHKTCPLLLGYGEAFKAGPVNEESKIRQ